MRAKLFRNGRSQAVRLPATCRFEGTEVEVKRDLRPALSACITCGRVLLNGCASVQNCWIVTLMPRPVLVSFSRGASRMLRLSKGIGREAVLHARHQCRSGVVGASFAPARPMVC